eukprot:SAG22_NODE_635_length_8370_cov_33.081127_5_plen_100_part_00
MNELTVQEETRPEGPFTPMERLKELVDVLQEEIEAELTEYSAYIGVVRQRSSLLKAVITAFPSVSLPFLVAPLRSQPTLVAISTTRRPPPSPRRKWRLT